MVKNKATGEGVSSEIDVGRRLRELRMERGLSLRALAARAGLNVNTLSLIENGKTSPSVSTLQQVAAALETSMAAFFETDTPLQKIVHQQSAARQVAAFAHGNLADLGAGFARPGMGFFVITIDPSDECCGSLIVHTGLEFVYCLEGWLQYEVDGQQFDLHPGDSLVFEAHLPHRWRNAGSEPSRSLLLLCPDDERDRPDERHFL